MQANESVLHYVSIIVLWEWIFSSGLMEIVTSNEAATIS